jgi:hypothetical protein
MAFTSHTWVGSASPSMLEALADSVAHNLADPECESVELSLPPRSRAELRWQRLEATLTARGIDLTKITWTSE